MTPLVTKQPATRPMRGTLKTSRTSASPVTTSSYSGLSRPSERVVDVFEDVVDDLVEAQLHVLALRELARVAVGTHVEPDDRRVRHDGQVDVGLADPTDTAMHERQPHLVVLGVELAQRVGERFERTLGVGLHDEVERRDLAALHHREDVFEARATRQHHRAALGGRLATVGTRFGDRAGDLVARCDPELVAGQRHVVEPEHLDRHRRPGFGDLQAVLVEHRADATPGVARDDGVADVQRAFFDERGDDGTATRVQVGLEHVRLGRLLRVGDEVFGDLDVGHEQQRVEELFDADTRGRGDVEDDRLTAPLLRHELLLGQLLPHPGRVGVLAVGLRDRHDDRDFGRTGVRDRLHRLRHHTVVGRDHEDRDVGDLRAARPHGGERLVARRVDEGDATIAAIDLVRADRLGDAAGFAGDDVGVSDRVEQRRLAVVDVTHDRDHRRPRLEQGIVFFVVVTDEQREQLDLLFAAGLDEQHLRAERLRDELDHLVGERCRRRDHLARLEEESHEVGGGAVQPGRELLDRDAARHHDLALGDRRVGR